MIHAKALQRAKGASIARSAIFPAQSAAPDPIGRGEAAGFSRRIRRRNDSRDSAPRAKRAVARRAIFPADPR